MFDACIVKNCAPTLAGLKTASLFTCPCTSRESLRESSRQLNQRLRHKGLRILPLRFSRSKALVYVYRPWKLRSDLSHPDAQKLLHCRGYLPGSCEFLLRQLAQRLREQEEFPHEIGLFLGYPPEDVCGFLENGGCGCKCFGCWKVYGDEEEARKQFRLYRKCTRVYCDCFRSGSSIDRLTVAG